MSSWQVVPSNQIIDNIPDSNFSIVIDPEEKNISFSGEHSFSDVNSILFKIGEIGEIGENGENGENGEIICSLNVEQKNFSECQIDSKIAELIYANKTYVQINTAKYPDGIVRGQIVSTEGSQNVIPNLIGNIFFIKVPPLVTY